MLDDIPKRERVREGGWTFMVESREGFNMDILSVFIIKIYKVGP